MDFVWLDDFLALAEHRSFSRAADARNVTQPTFSRRIRALEVWVGVTLFDRRTHIVKLTEAGESFRPAAQEALRRLLEGRLTAREEGGLVEPTLRFAATHTVALMYFPKWVHSLAPELTKMGRVQLIADSTPACEKMMISGQAQFLLCHYHPAMNLELRMPQFQSVCIANDELIPVSAPDLNAEPIFSLPGSASAPVPYLAYGEQSGLAKILQAVQLDQRSQVFFKSVFASHMASVLAVVVRQGTGLAWLPKSLVEADLRSGILVRAGDPSWDVEIQVQLFRPRSRQSAAAEGLWRRIIRRSEQAQVSHLSSDK